MIDCPQPAHIIAASVSTRTGDGASVVTEIVGMALTTIPGGAGGSSGRSSEERLISGTLMLGNGENFAGDLSSSSSMSEDFLLVCIPLSKLLELFTLTGGLGKGRRVVLNPDLSRERTDARVSERSRVASTGDWVR